MTIHTRNPEERKLLRRLEHQKKRRREHNELLLVATKPKTIAFAQKMIVYHTQRIAEIKTRLNTIRDTKPKLTPPEEKEG